MMVTDPSWTQVKLPKNTEDGVSYLRSEDGKVARHSVRPPILPTYKRHSISSDLQDVYCNMPSAQLPYPWCKNALAPTTVSSITFSIFEKAHLCSCHARLNMCRLQFGCSWFCLLR